MATTRTGQMRTENGSKPLPSLPALEKAITGIKGLDDISGGGLPRGRTTIVCGGPGSGKTMLGLEFLIRGAMEFNEPGVLMAFEEPPEEMVRNVASLGFDLQGLADKKKLYLDYVRIDPNEIEETGDYDLEGLFVRLQHAVDSVGAKRVMLDTLEALFTGFSNVGVLRSEIRRLFRWLKERGLTAVVTAEQGEGKLTRHGLEEYVSDCVIMLDHRIHDQISTRRMRIVKYRGTQHGSDEYPFLIDSRGLSVLPASTLSLQHNVSTERVLTGVPDLDEMLGGKGFYRGTTVLVSGTAGSGKTTMAAQFAQATCQRGERCLFIGFEESPGQVFRNLQSVGLEMDQWVKKNLLFHHAWRPTQYGLEMHLLRVHRLVEDVNPQTIVLDPITTLITGTAERETAAMIMRMIDFLKGRQVTGFFTSLTKGGRDLEATEQGLSSLIDTWILLREIEFNAERNRALSVLKSRGMEHSNQMREFILTSQGIKLRPVYMGGRQVLTGSSRLAQEARDREDEAVRLEEFESRRDKAEQRRRALQAQMDALQAELAHEERQLKAMVQQTAARDEQAESDRKRMSASRRETNDSEAHVQAAGGQR